jgi:hypothetical protein
MGPERCHSPARLAALQPPSLLDTAAARPHVPGSPRLGVLRRLRLVPDRSAVGAPNPNRRAGRVAVGKTGTVPVFTVIRLTKEEPDSVPAASPRLPRSTSSWSPGQSLNTSHRSSPPGSTGAHRSRPISTRFEPVRALRDVNTGSLRTPFHLARRTRTIWQY